MNKIMTGGLKKIEIDALLFVYKRNAKLTRYALAKLLKIDKKQAYRIANKLGSSDYLELKEGNVLLITDLGENLCKWIGSRNANIIYKCGKLITNMVEVNCTKCGDPITFEAITCMECSEKEIKEDSGGSCLCDLCGKELLGRTADQEITLFYKDANKDFNFCSRKCLMKFVQNKLED